MKHNFDLNKISGDGYLIIPVSMSRMTAGQTPKEIYEIVDYFTNKITTFSNDVIILYTNGLYFNEENISHEKRVKYNEKILNHANELRNLIEKKRQYIPGAFHFLPIDYIILNSREYSSYFNILKKKEKEDPDFRECIKLDIGDRKYNEAHVNFILEEIAVSHIIKQRLIQFPRTLVKNDIWRLLVYSGKHTSAEAYQWKKRILPRDDKINPYSGTQYNYDSKKLIVFDDA